MRWFGDRGVLVFVTGVALLTSMASAQELPKSGTHGIDLFYATSPTGTSQMYAVSLTLNPDRIGVGSAVAAVPSRWAHRRRTLGALETAIAFIPPAARSPMGSATGNGSLHLIDARGGPPVSVLIPTGNPAGYDLLVVSSMELVFSAEDDGAGGTTLRGFSYATPGSFTPTSPATLTLPGSPAAYVNRIGYDAAGESLHVPTATGIAVVMLSPSAPQMAAGPFISTAAAAPTTNPTSFVLGGTRQWIVGTSEFNATGGATKAGYRSWTAAGATTSGEWGLIPNLAPPRNYVPAAGCSELAVVDNQISAYVYYLLRDPSPTAFFIRPSAVGVVRFIGATTPVVSKIICPDNCGEPFSIPAVHGTRIAIRAASGPPFYNDPAGGGEVISILYSPLDPLGV